MPVSLVCCGLIGAGFTDTGMLERAYAEACATQGVVPGTADYAHCMVEVHRSIGQPPVDVFRSLFPEGKGRAEAAAVSFERSLRTAVDRTGLTPVPGAPEAICELRDSGLRVCLVTGLSRRLLGVVIDALGWWRKADLALCADDAPRGYPWPDLLLTAMLRMGVTDVRETCFVGATTSGVQSATRAGVGIVVGLLSGPYTEDRLRAAGATHVLGGIAELPALLASVNAESCAPAAASAPSPRVPLERRSAGL